jgi:hypothetical protein
MKNWSRSLVWDLGCLLLNSSLEKHGANTIRFQIPRVRRKLDDDSTPSFALWWSTFDEALFCLGQVALCNRRGELRSFRQGCFIEPTLRCEGCRTETRLGEWRVPAQANGRARLWVSYCRLYWLSPRGTKRCSLDGLLDICEFPWSKIRLRFSLNFRGGSFAKTQSIAFICADVMSPSCQHHVVCVHFSAAICTESPRPSRNLRRLAYSNST